MRRPLILVVLATSAVFSAYACDCDSPRPACAYIGADAIFLGHVTFTNDDGSGTFVQATLVRFDVEEIFKGIPAGTKQVWVDPGSFTSCYEVYRLGERWLIVASRQNSFPTGSATMTVVRGRAGFKPLPPGVSPLTPPPVNWAPECSGSRRADFRQFETDLAMLRAYRGGKLPPRVFGFVVLMPFSGWPYFGGPKLSGARVTLQNGNTVLHATTGDDGAFFLGEAPPGTYNISAMLPPYVPARQQTSLTVPQFGCGSADVALQTTSEISGVVLDAWGRPARQIPVQVEAVNTVADYSPSPLATHTDRKGKFAIMGIPDTDVRLSYGAWKPSSGVQYALNYYRPAVRDVHGGTLLLRPGERRKGFVLRLPPPLEIRKVAVRVLRADGAPVAGAYIDADSRIAGAESAQTGASGAATLRCLTGFDYEVEAFTSDGFRGHAVPLLCGKNAGPLTIMLESRGRL